MPYKERLCGIYAVISPCGGKYIGSSEHIKGRFSDHKSDLKHGTHPSSKLQDAYNKYGSKLEYVIEELCEKSQLLILEKQYMDNCDNLLNESHHPTNVWKTQQIREKIKLTRSSKEHKEKMKVIYGTPKTHWVSVDCSDGRTFASYALAAKEFGVTTSRILMLCKTQKVGNLGVKFKKSEDEWITEYPKRTRKPHSEETKQLMRNNRKNWKPSDLAIRASALVNSKSVIGTNISTGNEILFTSQKDAALFAHHAGNKEAASQINRAANRKRKSAFGYYWRYA